MIIFRIKFFSKLYNRPQTPVWLRTYLFSKWYHSASGATQHKSGSNTRNTVMLMEKYFCGVSSTTVVNQWCSKKTKRGKKTEHVFFCLFFFLQKTKYLMCIQNILGLFVAAYRSWSWGGNGLRITFEGGILKNKIKLCQRINAHSSRVPMAK